MIVVQRAGHMIAVMIIAYVVNFAQNRGILIGLQSDLVSDCMNLLKIDWAVNGSFEILRCPLRR